MKNYKEKKLWDIVVRVFHWSLVIFVILAFISSEEGASLHIKAGYVIIALVLMRIVWGFIGTEHARFANFVKGPKKVFTYLKGLLTGRPPYYFGHNPAGGIMIVLLLVTLLGVAFTGIKTEQGESAKHASIDKGSVSSFSIVTIAHADDDYFKRGNGSHAGARASHEQWEEAHEFFAGLLLALIAIHVTAILMTWIIYKENLIKSMITGRKSVAILPRG